MDALHGQDRETRVSDGATIGGGPALAFRSALASVPEVGWSERQAANRVRASLFGTATTPLLPRYELLRAIGRGAMGEVWAARDPALDREVAIKLLLPSDELADAAIERLAREARALARLSHPNVVQVFDLGTYGPGQGGRGLFIVMELVRGVSLATWLERPRAWRAVVDVFVQAGRGLAAAHAAGMVHRDVKPGNVLVGDDGRVRVGDFGLARLADLAGTKRRAEAMAATEVELAATLAGDLTETGTVVGTPLYMAPEQHRGATVDARSDQYAFCVALFEAVYRRWPFAGSMHAIVEAKHARHLPAPTREDASIPEALRAAILHGLEPDPSKRWPSMDALVDALQRVGQRRRVGIGVATAGVCALVGAGSLAGDPRACTPGTTVGGHWGPAQRSGVREGLAVGLDAARVDAALAQLDGWFAGLASAYDDACAIDPGRDTARWDCLHGARSQFDALVDAASAGDATRHGAIANLTLALPEPARCAGAGADASVAPMWRPVAEELAARLGQARVLLDLGRPQASLALAESAKATIAELPAGTGLEPLLARAHFATGAAYWQLMAAREAEDEFTAAYFTAVEYADAYQFEAGCRLASLTASQSRNREAGQWLAHCEAAYDADPQRHEQSSLVLARGVVANHALDWDAALRAYGDVIAMCGTQRCAQTGSTARHNLARLHTVRGDDARAFAAWRDVAEFDAALFGRDADGVLLARAYMADARIADAPAEALAELDAVLALQEEAARSDAETEVEMLEIRAAAKAALGRTDDALHDALAALARARTTQSPALLVFALGRAAGAAEDVDVDRALALYTEALAVPLDEPRQRCVLHLGRGSLAFREGRYAEGHADHDAARRLALEALGPRDSTLAIIEANVAQAWREQGRPELAVAAFDRAIAAYPPIDAGDPEPEELVAYRRARAEVLSATPR